MTLSDTEHHLVRRFMERDIAVSLQRVALSRGEALAVWWMKRPSFGWDVKVGSRGVIYMAVDAPLEEIILDIEAAVARAGS